MADLVENLEHDSRSHATIANCPSKMQNLQTQGGGALWKKVEERKRINKSKSMESIATKESITESSESKRLMYCICAPPTHQASFKCRFHRKLTSQKFASCHYN